MPPESESILISKVQSVLVRARAPRGGSLSTYREIGQILRKVKAGNGSRGASENLHNELKDLI